MGLQAGNIDAIQEPVQLLGRQRDHAVLVQSRPGEARLFQALLPQTKTAALPVEDLDTGAAPVAEHE